MVFKSHFFSDGGIVLRHPRLMNSTEWVDDMWWWPQVSYGDIFYYLVLAVDGSAMKNVKSTQAYQYLHSGKVGRVLHSKNEKEEYLFLKAAVKPSQSSTLRLRAFCFRDMLPFVSDENNEGRLLLCER